MSDAETAFWLGMSHLVPNSSGDMLVRQEISSPKKRETPEGMLDCLRKLSIRLDVLADSGICFSDRADSIVDKALKELSEFC
jgi:hypothetical protein